MKKLVSFLAALSLLLSASSGLASCTSQTDSHETTVGETTQLTQLESEQTTFPATKPEETTAEPEETTAEPEETTAEPETNGNADDPLASPENKPEETTAEPEETTAEPEETTAEPEETTAEPEETTAEPEETTAEPEETTAEPEETTVEPEGTTPNEPEETEIETEPEPVKDNLPDGLNFGGMEIVLGGWNNAGLTNGEIWVSEANGNPINDAVFERNQAIEERLNVKLVHISEDDSGELLGKVIRSIQAGEDLYDLVVSPAYAIYPYTLQGYFRDLNDFEHVDLSQPWWNQSYNEAISYKGSQFSAVNSSLLSVYRSASVTVFNKNLFAAQNQTSLYEYVKKGTWTMDTQASLLSAFYQDNGDAEGDRYGFVSAKLQNVDAYWSALGLDIIGKDEDGNLVSVVDTDRIYSATNKILSLYADEYSCIFETSDWIDMQAGVTYLFANGYAAMATLQLTNLESGAMQTTLDDYGVVPMPKFDEAQSDYRTPVQASFSVMAVPVTIWGDDDSSAVSAVMEAMGSAGHNMILPAYKAEVLGTDTDTEKEMADIIMDGVHVDLGLIYPDLNYVSALREMIDMQTNNTATRLKVINKITGKKLKQIMKKLEKILS